ncbi:1-(5-phosphoribosyl)-5-[(5-phosphoribosylamino)methylideneamino] imidazole-4-carboxamide isomerase [Moorella thermoacetica]|uniref:1-(5-phosphoribosyl)-5-[(5- phosphoribosylamino)methylideneamino]imidazole-4- carboxamide isomerase n=1 Tax=Neomoorella thermoacetica TaxID=1525 RepID=UPI0030CD9A0C
MLVMPAIDLREGRCVRLYQGRIEAETVYSTDPVAVARGWVERGARWLHVVDLDGAFAGRPRNLEVIAAIIRAAGVPVQVGGGIRSLESLAGVLAAGASRVVLGTVAITNPEVVATAVERYGERVVVGIDSLDGQVAIEGWEATVARGAVEFARQMASLGVTRAVFTDIGRDGTLQGPNIAATREMAHSGGLKIIASGGIASLDDLRKLKELAAEGVEGAILGRSLYNGNFTLEEALAVAADGD